MEYNILKSDPPIFLDLKEKKRKEEKVIQNSISTRCCHESRAKRETTTISTLE